ncbi:constitutive coactivator of peroxisome proliferator-activated receptor gamma isoform X3 [Labrus mixtus]|uniref:constitutive coactivator of peroxisome proliferator-activated receptor gamma isoform X3 n=1 Tax=Labrus mixtus TaxID=508554 RepID=UPI0029C00DB7|nr:constitutive coactivator of peroxisome proliferator-activated receptor gamma isoform X3 [Labrus mixtus]
MGVKGLQSFMERCCPGACVTVNLKQMARKHADKIQQGFTTPANTYSPTLVVDGMACLRHWYSCKDWVCGGQWKEYMEVLKSWVEAFTSAGIRLVFFFDGVVEEQKRKQWVKRRRRVNGEISKMFRHLKAHGEQPGRELFCLPSGLATFTHFALRLLGQEVFCSVREADYEIASYARQHKSMGILGQDSDFIIYDSAPYFSVAKLQIHSLTTVLYNQERLCQTVGLDVNQLPLLACLLGNDVVSEEKMQHIRNNAISTYRINNPASHSDAPPGQMVLAVSHFVSLLWRREEEDVELILHSLNLSAPLRELLQRGISSYILPGQEALQQGYISAPSSAFAFEKHVSPEILKACREKHVAADGFMVYSIVCEGVIECSNTLEDEEDTELLPHALVYKPCRQRIYGLVLLHGHDGCSDDPPVIREWFVYPGNPLKDPDMVHPVPISLPGDQPSLDLLWFGTGPDVSALRLMSFFSIFDCQEFSELHGVIEDSLLAALCLVTYIALQLPVLCSRALQLGSLFVRGLGNLLGANYASGCPLPSAALMPWQCFDGRLFHSKYLLAHNSAEKTVLLENDSTCLSVFLCLREKLTEACMKRSKVLQSRPKPPEQSHKTTPGPRYRERQTGEICQSSGSGKNWREQGEMTGGRQHGGGWREQGEMTGGRQHGGGWREQGEMTGGRQHGGGWREQGEMTGGQQHGGGWREQGEMTGERREYGNREGQWERGGYRGGGYSGRQHFPPNPHSYADFQDEGPYDTSRHPKQSRGGSNGSRGRYHLAPRWSRPPTSGT